MRNTVAKAESVSRQGSRRFRLVPLAAALAACSLLGAGAAQAALIFDSSGTNEPTNNLLATATPGVAGDEFRGCVGFSGPFCPPDTTTGSGDDVDFVGYFGLNPLAIYTLSLAEFCVLCGVSVTYDLYRNFSTSIDQSRELIGGATTDIPGLTGLTNLKVGMESGGCCEGYGVTLTLTSAPTGKVSEPASTVLLAAGLAAAFAARRRKRS
jgi:hypothetical protein